LKLGIATFTFSAKTGAATATMRRKPTASRSSVRNGAATFRALRAPSSSVSSMRSGCAIRSA